MQQQVNLLSGFTPPPKEVLHAKQILQIVGALVFVLLAYYGYAYWEFSKVQKARDTLKVQQEIKAQELLELAERFPKDAAKEELEGEVESLAREIESKSSLVKTMARANEGFSPYLEELAKEIVPGVWLKEIIIDQEKASVSLLGYALDSDLIPTFLQQLSQSKPFMSIDFKQLRMVKTKVDKKPVIGFALRTIPLSAEDDILLAQAQGGEQEESEQENESGGGNNQLLQDVKRITGMLGGTRKGKSSAQDGNAQPKIPVQQLLQLLMGQ